MKRLELAEFPLTGVTLIEASAGTGKTFSIVRLYLRQVLEAGRRAEEIVVASFTNAAADELRRRIRLGLAEALAASDALAGEADLAALLQAHRPEGERDFAAIGYLVGRAVVAELGQGEGEGAPAIDDAALRIAYRLRLAQLALDVAPIGTIDAICGRWATEYALQAGISLRARERSDGRPELAAAIRNEVLHLQGLPPEHEDAALLARLRALGDRNAHLEGWLTAMIASGVAPPAAPADLAGARARAMNALARVAEVFESGEEPLSRAKDSVYALMIKEGRLAPLREALAGAEPLAPELLETARAVACASIVKGWMTDKQRQSAAPEWLATIATLRAALTEIVAAPLMGALRRSCERVRAGLERIKADQDVVTFDDLTRELLAALEASPALRARIRRDYPVALVDEFQDSSPAQSAIFQRVYAGTGGALVMIGDPKQAIYGFRGGDVFAYHAARPADEARRYRLPKNYRSSAPFLDAINALFDEAHAPFATDKIDYEPVAPGAPWADAPALEAGGAPLAVLLVPQARAGLPGVAAVPPYVLQAVEHHLDPSGPGVFEVEDGGALAPRPARPGDLAILVRTNRGARAIYEALSRCGYPVATRTQDSIFDSAEAGELLRLLTALVHPTDGSRVRAALATDLLAHSLEDLRGQHENEGAEEAALLRFSELRRGWDEQGILAVLYRLLTGRAAALLARPGGTRCLTNWLQLAELSQRAEEQHGTPSRLLRWLRQLTRDAHARRAVGDEQLLRLETDGEAIQIVTLHRAKGLEYPLTILVDPWRALPGRRAPEALLDPALGPFTYHDGAGALALEFGGPERSACAERAFAEALQEDIRLAYVGLTRARYRCTLLWSERFDKRLWLNGTHWLLLDERSRSREGRPPPKASCTGRLEALAGAHTGRIELREAVDAHEHSPRRWAGGPVGREERPLACRPLEALPEDFWAVTSFSAIKRGARTDGNALEFLDVDEAAEPDEAAPAAPGDAPRAFLGGAGRSYGNAFHAVMEEALAKRPESDAAGTELAALRLARYGVADAGGTLARATWAQAQLVLSQPLTAHDGPALSLGALARAARVPELEFDVALRRHGTDALATVLAAHGHGPTAALLRQGRLPLEGLLHGFIDLTFAWEGRYYVLDYKTNWLGDARAAYAPAGLDRAMVRSSYDLQYLLYALAVDRWLAGLDPAYRYETHFGGAYYLFVRGMHGAGDEGVWFRRPEPALIGALGEVMCAGPEPAP